MDLGALRDAAAAVHSNQEVAFAIISREYIQTGLNWIHAMGRIGLDHFLVVAGDAFTMETLRNLGVCCVRAEVDEQQFDPSFVSRDGFSAKGVALCAFEYPVAHFLLKAGFHVVLSDADALWLRDPMPYLRHADLAFQRIVYHPPPIARLWGFAVCSGFLSFRAGPKAVAFVERCRDWHRLMISDQVAINLALLEGDPQWHCEGADWVRPVEGINDDRGSLEAAFAKSAKCEIGGTLKQGGISVLALPHDTFWRHGFVTPALPTAVISHPNSPKDDLQKMKIFDAMGLRFHPGQ